MRLEYKAPYFYKFKAPIDFLPDNRHKLSQHLTIDGAL